MKYNFIHTAIIEHNKNIYIFFKQRNHHERWYSCKGWKEGWTRGKLDTKTVLVHHDLESQFSSSIYSLLNWMACTIRLFTELLLKKKLPVLCKLEDWVDCRGGTNMYHGTDGRNAFSIMSSAQGAIGRGQCPVDTHSFPTTDHIFTLKYNIV